MCLRPLPTAPITLDAMDRVRFGRALGYGARHAAKSLAQAVDAATTPTPGKPPVARPASPGIRSRVAAAPATLKQASTHARVAGKSFWTPLAQFSSVLWLQVTGTFFLLIAGFFSQGLWKTRGAVHLPLHSPDAERFYLHLAAFTIFAYFAVSNFVRAYRRERRG
jgi:hypothetical protein